MFVANLKAEGVEILSRLSGDWELWVIKNNEGFYVIDATTEYIISPDFDSHPAATHFAHCLMRHHLEFRLAMFDPEGLTQLQLEAVKNNKDWRQELLKKLEG